MRMRMNWRRFLTTRPPSSRPLLLQGVQKSLEATSGARVLMRGKGARPLPLGGDAAPEDLDDLHVLIVGDSNEQVRRTRRRPPTRR